MPKIDIETAPRASGSSYPAPHDAACAGRHSVRLGTAGGLRRIGVNLVTLAPGAWSSQRHWHDGEDEFVYIIEGEVVLVEDGGETLLRAGDCAAFPAGVRDGHHLQNRSNAPARFLAVSDRNPADSGGYSDIDMVFEGDRYSGLGRFLRRDGTPFLTD